MQKAPSPTTPSDGAEVFAFFNEIGIINQLSTTLFAKTLPDGLHPSHFAILNHLYRTGDGKTPIRIAGAMQVTKMTMTHSLKVLSARGFIETAPNPEDARGKLVYLTEAGRSFRTAAIRTVSEQFRGLFGPEHLELMERIMEDLVIMRKHLDENR
jgi:DNA-binding MarR family transcriptional regulator